MPNDIFEFQYGFLPFVEEKRKEGKAIENMKRHIGNALQEQEFHSTALAPFAHLPSEKKQRLFHECGKRYSPVIYSNPALIHRNGPPSHPRVARTAVQTEEIK